MLGLSIMQPWASLIAFERKPIENRTWRPGAHMIGQRIAIHASKKLDLEAFEDLQDGAIEGFQREWWPYATPRMFPTSAVIAVATIVHVHVGEREGLLDPVYPPALPDDCKRWYGGPVGFELRRVVRVEPIACKGALGFWRLPDDVELAVRAQLKEAA